MGERREMGLRVRGMADLRLSPFLMIAGAGIITVGAVAWDRMVIVMGLQLLTGGLILCVLEYMVDRLEEVLERISK